MDTGRTGRETGRRGVRGISVTHTKTPAKVKPSDWVSRGRGTAQPELVSTIRFPKRMYPVLVLVQF